jgi:hypothetical protein
MALDNVFRAVGNDCDALRAHRLAVIQTIRGGVAAQFATRRRRCHLRRCGPGYDNI